MRNSKERGETKIKINEQRGENQGRNKMLRIRGSGWRESPLSDTMNTRSILEKGGSMGNIKRMKEKRKGRGEEFGKRGGWN
jgi:hypothetical protein